MNDLFGQLHIFNGIKKYDESNPVRYHMPGHKGGLGIPLDYWTSLIKADVTEIPGMDNLYHPNGFLEDAMLSCAKIFGTIRTFFLVNGSTVGIHAALEAVAGDKKEVILARDCHKAAYNKVIMGGFTPYYIPVGYDHTTLTPSVPASVDIAAVMDRTGCKTVMVTSPNYHGMCCDIKAIAQEVHKRNGILIVDEAHGAHFKFSTALPRSAIDCGADVVIQSAHKTLPVINQGAYLHVCSDRIDCEKINYALSMIQTSSPSYIIMGLLEFAGVYLHEYGNLLYNKICKEIQDLEADLHRQSDIKIKSGLCKNAADKDITRILINAREAGYTGFELERRLRTEYNVVVEAADLYNCILIATCSDPPAYLEILRKALKQGAIRKDGQRPVPLKTDGPLPEMALLPGEAVKKEKRSVKPEHAVGLIAYGTVIPYPPGIPLIVPGERITEEAVEMIRSILDGGGFIEGINGNLYMDVVK